MDAQDRIAAPVLLAAGHDTATVADLNQRDALEAWLSAPTRDQAKTDAALVAYLTE